MNILIKHGTVVTAEKSVAADVLIADGKIKRIDTDIPDNDAKVIDASGMYVIPGGIDPHVHLHLPTPAGYSSDDFHSGSIAALHGGTTTLIDFVTPAKGQSLCDALQLRIAEAQNCHTDYSFHVSPVDWRDTSEEEIQHCIESGFTSFKIYMAYKETVGLPDDSIYHVMKAVSKGGGMVTAHCELGDEVSAFRDFYANQHLTTPLYHMLSHPPRFEVNAVKRAIALADQAECPLYIVHVSVGESLKHVQQAQRGGQPVFAETCPHYLLLDESRYNGDFEETAKYVLSPPLRTPEDNNLLWDGINKNTVQTVGTDHCPFSFAQKAVGRDDFRKSPNGAGGVEHRLPLLYTYGVLQNRISMNKLVDVFATQPAKIFGIYPQKGEIIVGGDADIVVWNPNSESTISAKTHHSQSDLNIFEGTEVKGEALWVMANGNIVINNKKLSDSIPTGKLLKRKRQNQNNQYYKPGANNPTANNCGRT